MLSINTKICDLCGTCIGVCPNKALILQKELNVILESCINCGICVSICPVAALKLSEKK